jgi:hypothetical protein
LAGSRRTFSGGLGGLHKFRNIRNYSLKEIDS